MATKKRKRGITITSVWRQELPLILICYEEPRGKKKGKNEGQGIKRERERERGKQDELL